jgi:MFS family permease
VGPIAIPEGGLRAVFSYVGGRVTKYTGRVPVMTLSMLLQIAILVVLLHWEPKSRDLPVFLGITAVYGMVFGAMAPNISALIATAFPSGEVDMAFATFNMLDILIWDTR